MSSESEHNTKPDLRQLTKSKIMGKFFGRSKARDKDDTSTTHDDDVLDFLRPASSDRLPMTATLDSRPSAPPLSRLDTSKTQYSISGDSPYSSQQYVSLPRRPKRDTNGMKVRFTDHQPETIGYGGEEFEEPTIEISRAKEYGNNNTIPFPSTSKSSQLNVSPQRRLMRRAQTGMVSDLTLDMTPQSQQIAKPALRSPGIGRNVPQEEGKVILDYPQQGIDAQREAAMRASEGQALHSANTTRHEIQESRRSGSNSSANSHNSRPSQSSIRSQTSIPPPTTQTMRDTDKNPAAQDIDEKRNGPDRIPQTSISTISTVLLEHNQALDDFASRVQNSYKLFELSADSIKPLRQTSLDDIMRLASWWFLKGRSGIENAARVNGNAFHAVGLVKEQGHADLAKALWLIENAQQMCQDQGCPPISRISRPVLNSSHSRFDHILERCQVIEGHLGKIASSMRRNNFLPPLPEDAPLSAGIDNAIWYQPLPVPTDMYSILSNNGIKDVTSLDKPMDVSMSMPLGDTAKTFNYNRAFVNLYLRGEGFKSSDQPIQCIMSVSRLCNETELCLFLTDQSGILDMCIQSDKSMGLTWDSIQWLSDIKCLDLRLPRGLIARVQMDSSCFVSLHRLYEHIDSVLASFSADGEEVVYDKTLKSLEYFDSDPHNRHSFPTQPTPSCCIRLFSNSLRQSTTSGTRTRHSGYRVAIVTGTSTKHVNGIHYDIVSAKPILYEFMRGPLGDPSLSLSFWQNNKKTRLAMTFGSDHDRIKLHHLLIGGVAADETTLSKLVLEAFLITNMDGLPLQPDIHNFMAWSSVQVLNRGIDGVTDSEGSKVVSSDHLRLILTSKYGSFTDRINVSTGELRFKLYPSQPQEPATSLKVVVQRLPQDDVTLAVSESQVPRDIATNIPSYLNELRKQPTLREYHFKSLPDLHAFQAGITGYSILSDVSPVSFAIARRRMVVPIYKKWECSQTRVQIVRSEKVLQLLVWFAGFSHGDSMNFVLKETDTFESIGKADKCGIKFVDAKFPLPNGCKNESSEGQSQWSKGISLDDPPYPGEHDDITITFQSETERNEFAKQLPGSAKITSRMGSLKR